MLEAVAVSRQRQYDLASISHLSSVDLTGAAITNGGTMPKPIRELRLAKFGIVNASGQSLCYACSGF